MKMTFTDLFALNNDKQSVSPKRRLRLGGVILEPELVLTMGDASLGLDIATWVDKEFEVQIIDDCMTIVRVTPGPATD